MSVTVAGDVLVFLPGAEEIERCVNLTTDRYEGDDVIVLPLHSSLPLSQQMRVHIVVRIMPVQLKHARSCRYSHPPHLGSERLFLLLISRRHPSHSREYGLSSTVGLFAFPSSMSNRCNHIHGVTRAQTYSI
jgi:hypothetical protein